MRLLTRYFLFVLLGVIIGAAIVEVRFNFEVALPQNTEIMKIPVKLGNLPSDDQWLKDVRFELAPLDGVNSNRKYALLLLTPPPAGIHGPNGGSAWFDLVNSNHEQSFQIGPDIGIHPEDFGADGRETAIKFIDEEDLFSQTLPASSKNLEVDFYSTP